MMRMIVTPYRWFVKYSVSYLRKVGSLLKEVRRPYFYPPPSPSPPKPHQLKTRVHRVPSKASQPLSLVQKPLSLSLSLPPQVLSRRAPLLNYWPVSALPQNPGPTIPPSTSHPPKRPSLTGACTHRNTRRDPCSDFAP